VGEDIEEVRNGYDFEIFNWVLNSASFAPSAASSDYNGKKTRVSLYHSTDAESASEIRAKRAIRTNREDKKRHTIRWAYRNFGRVQLKRL